MDLLRRGAPPKRRGGGRAHPPGLRSAAFRSNRATGGGTGGPRMFAGAARSGNPGRELRPKGERQGSTYA